MHIPVFSTPHTGNGASPPTKTVGGNIGTTTHFQNLHPSPLPSHYHKKMTEIYLVLEGEGHIELDGESLPVKPLTTVMIKPGCRHRAVGNMKIINVPIPKFDPDDEWLD